MCVCVCVCVCVCATTATSVNVHCEASLCEYTCMGGAERNKKINYSDAHLLEQLMPRQKPA